MRRALEVVRPRSLGTWIVYLLALPVVLLTLANAATGTTDIQQLREQGENAVVKIVDVRERGADGQPTKVVVDNVLDGVYHELDDLAGSIQGDSVRVRVYAPATVMMSETKYEHASLLKEVLAVSLLPLLFAAAVVAAMQWRQVYGRTSPSYWGDRLGRPEQQNTA
jgi:hypothetical protein